MATGNLDSADLKGVAFGGLINEDVMQQIWDISAIPLPFSDRIESDPATNSYTEWTQDRLEDPDLNNANVDGADATGNDTQTGKRVGNHCQNSDKVVKVSNRANNSDTVGRSNELAYQVMRRQQALRRDLEAISMTQQASVADDGDSVAGKAGGFYAWLTTNSFRGATGADGGFANGIVSAPTPGTKRALSEKLVRDCAQAVWKQGGNPTILESTPDQIRLLSEYMFSSSAKIATLTSDVQQQRSGVVATGSVNVFITDFGVTLSMIPNRLMPAVVPTPGSRNVNVGIIDPDYVRHGFLQGFQVQPLAKTGTAENRQMTVDWTVKMLNEEAHGVIADCDDEAAVIAA